MSMHKRTQYIGPTAPRAQPLKPYTVILQPPDMGEYDDSLLIYHESGSTPESAVRNARKFACHSFDWPRSGQAEFAVVAIFAGHLENLHKESGQPEQSFYPNKES